MANPLVFAAGTTTANLTRAIKVVKAELLQASATAATALVTDLNGNIHIPLMSIPATIAASQVLDYVVPKILPGGAIAPASGSAIPNFIVTVTGAGASLYLTFR